MNTHRISDRTISVLTGIFLGGTALFVLGGSYKHGVARARMAEERSRVAEERIRTALSLESEPAVSELRVNIREWTVPTKGAHPHDPAVAPDGSLWFTEQLQNKLGRLDPESGTFKEYALKIEDSGPHGLVADADGNIWFTGNGKGYIGKLDPKTGDVRVYKMPDAKAEDPHTAVFDSRGITERAFRFSVNLGRTRWQRLIRGRWRLRNTSCRKARGRGGWRPMPRTRFTLRIITAGIWGGWIRRRVR